MRVTEFGGSGEISFYIQHGKLFAKGNGHPVEMTVQDTGNEPQRGIDCYERLKREGTMVFDFFSTPVSM